MTEWNFDLVKAPHNTPIVTVGFDPELEQTAYGISTWQGDGTDSYRLIHLCDTANGSFVASGWMLLPPTDMKEKA
jgi:hypothetical protein